ncbi:alpha/beta fold hydrolase [Geminicoccus harenae]|uniref:alpha/beta fold hydrolase n=1 Tax=Geminicoccus harenae TaxID=2498453 RepID=UPI00168B35D1|nr:alpha/beta hydrolase [Geminicoccus harenae]
MFRTAYAPQSVWTDVPSLGIAMHARVWPGDTTYEVIPVVLVHGLGLSSRSMVPLGRRLAALGYEVLAPDLPGFGSSPAPVDAPWPAGSDVRAQADQLLAWMDARNIRKAVLFGNSLGVQAVVDLAVRFPHRVERLVLAGPPPDPAYRTPLSQYAHVLMNMPFEAPSLNPIMQADYASCGIPRMVQQLRRTVRDPIEQRLPAVQAPALVIRGEHDQALSQAWAEEFTRLLPDGRLVVIEGAAHNVQYTAARVTARLMHAFLQGALTSDAAAAADGVVVPRLADTRDPLAAPKPISTRLHGMLDYATALLCLTLPRALGCSPRTQQVLATNGMMALGYSLFTDYELGAARKIPMPAHLNMDAAGGVQLLLASATVLRGAPAPERLAVAALGLFHLFAAASTQMPMGPARLVPVAAGRRHPPMGTEPGTNEPAPARDFAPA